MRGSEEQGLKFRFGLKDEEMNGAEQSCACSALLPAVTDLKVTHWLFCLPEWHWVCLLLGWAVGVGSTNVGSTNSAVAEEGLGSAGVTPAPFFAINTQTPSAPPLRTFQLGKSSF